MFAQFVHGGAAAEQAVQDDHGLAPHGRQVSLAADPLQLGVALVEGAGLVSQIVFVQQPAMTGQHIVLDSPLMKK